MAREFLTDADVELEIERLVASEAVKLARKERQIAQRKRQYMYQLRWLEKRGLELMAKGVTLESLNAVESSLESEGE